MPKVWRCKPWTLDSCFWLLTPGIRYIIIVRCHPGICAEAVGLNALYHSIESCLITASACYSITVYFRGYVLLATLLWELWPPPDWQYILCVQQETSNPTIKLEGTFFHTFDPVMKLHTTLHVVCCYTVVFCYRVDGVRLARALCCLSVVYILSYTWLWGTLSLSVPLPSEPFKCFPCE